MKSVVVIAGRQLTPNTYEHVSGSTRYIDVSDDVLSVFFEHLNGESLFETTEMIRESKLP